MGETSAYSQGDEAPRAHGEDRILTAPNVISLIRLLLVPVFFIVYVFYGQIIWGTVIFVIAACTDWLDGTVARSTGQVTKLGKALDPLVDRVLLIFGVIAVFATGHIPLWVMVLIFLRDVILGAMTLWMKRVHHNNFTVAYVGKAATACMMTAFAMLILQWPMVPGLGWVEISWLPGLGAGLFSLGIFLAYIGVVLQWIAAGVYLYRGLRYGTTAKGGVRSSADVQAVDDRPDAGQADGRMDGQADGQMGDVG